MLAAHVRPLLRVDGGRFEVTWHRRDAAASGTTPQDVAAMLAWAFPGSMTDALVEEVDRLDLSGAVSEAGRTAILTAARRAPDATHVLRPLARTDLQAAPARSAHASPAAGAAWHRAGRRDRRRTPQGRAAAPSDCYLSGKLSGCPSQSIDLSSKLLK